MSVRLTFAAVLAGLALGAASAGAVNGGTAVKVPHDVDVYDQPGGEGEKRPHFLKGGSEVYLLEERADHWCDVQFDKGGTGWIWCGKNEKEDYSVEAVAAETSATDKKAPVGVPPYGYDFPD